MPVTLLSAKENPFPTVYQTGWPPYCSYTTIKNTGMPVPPVRPCRINFLD